MKGTEHKQFRCTFPGCDKVFNRRDYLERHATNHLSVKPYVCVLCNRHFSRKDLYDNHLTTKRHARVTHEAEQANYEHHHGKAPISRMIEEQDMGLGSSPRTQHHRPLPGSNTSLGEVMPGFDTDNQPRLSVYAPPIRQPLHLSGPGPGFAHYDRGSSERSGSMRDGMHSGESSLSPHSQNSTYRYYSDNMSMEMGGSANSAHGFPEPGSEIEMSWAGNPYAGQKLNGMPPLSEGHHHQAESIVSGRFSAYGVSLGLGSTATSSTGTRSEISVTDEYSTDLDTQGSVSGVNERIRRDMTQNPTPFPTLRENLSKASGGHLEPKDSFSAALGASSGLTGASGTGENDLLVIKDEGTKEPTSSASAVVAAVGDERYGWFFDDNFTTEKSKLGYDRCYAECVSIYQDRSDEYASHHSSTQQFGQSSKILFDRNLSARSDDTNRFGGRFNVRSVANKFSFDGAQDRLADQFTMRQLFPERAAKVLSVLRENSPELDFNAVDQCIQAAWIGADAIKHIVHPATFDPNNTHLALLAVLALIGMSLSEDRLVSAMARRAYAPVFLYAYESLVQLPSTLSPSRLDVSTVNKFQAFSLLLRYERLILIGDGLCSSFTRSSPGKYATDLFLGKALAAIPHVGEFSTPRKQQPIWATTTSEGYMFHQGADSESQWREWALIEATKRTVHFALYCDEIVTLTTSRPNPVSIFNMDIQMICPDPLWQSLSSNEFFFISGPSGLIMNVPYLGLIKSLIRFPRVAMKDDLGGRRSELPQISAPWSIFALKSIAHGLIMIVGKLSGLIPHGDEMLKAVMQSSSGSNPSGNIFSKFDRQLQARLYRGLDVWYHYFSAAYGDVTDRIFTQKGTMSTHLRDDFESSKSEDDEIPQYALIIILCHYSSFIFVHEDLPVVLQVTANLKSWLETQESKSLQLLLDFLYMPLYTNWIKTDEAKGMVGACSMYLAWSHAVIGSFHTGNHLFLSAMIYISAIVVWLYDFANNDFALSGASSRIDNLASNGRDKVRLENFEFMDDAVQYIQAVHKHVTEQAGPPQTRAVNSVLLLAACLLHRRKSTKYLVEMLIQLLVVMDPEHTAQELAAVVKNSKAYYEERTAKANQAFPLNAPQRQTSQDDDTHTMSSSEHSVMSDMDADLANISDIDQIEVTMGV